mmetsp:Transcript_80639/g.127390  ORF Transcript_80639/g.127390 Transcript_80639/m.127390 type:complete len:196 (-) Transcript_80639:145-732(-)
MSDDDGELSDSTRAALRIQQEIDGTAPATSKAPAKGSKQKGEAKTAKRSETHGAITGIALGEYAPSSSGVQIKMKGGKGLFSESLESLAYRADSDDEVNPEAPSGSFRRKDLEREAGNAGKKANVGLDGKVYAFIDAPSDESSAEGIQKGESKKNKDKSKKKSKKDKKTKKDGKKKEKKKKAKKRKRSSTSSSDT